MGVAVFFELFWLDCFPAGSFIPPHGLFATLAALVVLETIPGEDLPLTALVLVISAAGAMFMVLQEHGLRFWNNQRYIALLAWVQKTTDTSGMPWNVFWLAIAEQFAVFFTIFFLLTGMLSILCQQLLPFIGASGHLSWPHLWLPALSGGLLSLRIQRAYALLIVGLLIEVLLFL